MRKTAAILVTLAITCAATGAKAAVMQMVYSGTVTNSYDQTGLFGTGGAATLNGQAFTATFVFDTAIGRFTTATSDGVYGGTSRGKATPILSATLTINGHAEVILGNFNGTEQRFVYGSNSYGSSYAQDAYDTELQSVDNILQGLSSAGYGIIPLDIAAAFALGAVPNPGYFQFATYDLVAQRNLINAHGDLITTGVAVSPYSVPQVPLPASGLLLIGAIGGVVALGRRVG